MPTPQQATPTKQTSRVGTALVFAAAGVGLTLLLDSIRWTSATYDEVAYMHVAARWWRTGKQTQSPAWDHPSPSGNFSRLLYSGCSTGCAAAPDRRSHRPSARVAAARSAGRSWIWLAALGLCAGGAGGFMVQEPWPWRPGFELSPNLIAHGKVTMELPVLAFTTAMLFLFWSSWKPAAGDGSGPRPRWADWPSLASSPRYCFPTPGSYLVARQLVPLGLQRLAGSLPRHAEDCPGNGRLPFGVACR